MTIRMMCAAVLVGASMLTVGIARAESPKVVAALGHDLAQKFCSRCHLIEPGAKNPPDHVGGPSFQSVADRTEMTRDALREHLKTTHSNAMIPLEMPNPGLSEDELNKIVTYLLSLKPKQH